MSNSLKDLAENRKKLLLAESVAWLHDMGKCDERQLRKTAKLPPNEKLPDEIRAYEYKTAHSQLVGSGDLELLNERVSLKKLVEEGRPENQYETSKPWLVRALGYCHNVAHTEKEEEAYYLSRQDLDDTRRSNPFGYESEPFTELQAKLSSLPFSQLSARSTFKPRVEEAFSDACGDTRRPLNDVTLWDWSSMVAAFYKAALAAAVLGYKEDPPNLRWRLLSVRFNGASFSERVVRIPDLLGRKRLLIDGLNRIRTLLEETYPLGTEVYRDEDGSVFIVPDIEDLLNLQSEQGEKLSTLIIHKFGAGTIDEKPFLQLGGELTPALTLGDPWSWKDVYSHQKPLSIAEHTQEIPASPADAYTVSRWWQGYSEDICTVCQLRPQGWGASSNKALERKVCAICEQRSEGRSKRWTGERERTIWIDEAADADGRLALVVGRFGLEHWLDGTMIFYPAGKEGRHVPSQLALRVRSMHAPLKEGQVLKIRGDDYIWDDALGILKSLKEIQEEQIPRRFKDDRLHIDTTNEDVQATDVQRLPQGTYRVALSKLPPGLTAGNILRIQGQDFYIVGDGERVETASDRAVKVIENKTLHPGYLMVEQAIRLYEMEEAQTPARLYRVWETTLQFWQKLEGELGSIVDKVSPRLRIEVALPGTELRDKLPRFHTYELKLGTVNLSITCVAEGEFLTVDNLERVAILSGLLEGDNNGYFTAATHLLEHLQGKTFEVEQPTGYGSSNRPLGKLQVTNVTFDLTPYVPAIPLLTEPNTFMVLVPADKALQVMQAIKEKYEKEVGKVHNRLPMVTGIVFAGARTPLSAILDAGRRILNQPVSFEQWKIKRFEKVIESPNRGPWPSRVDFTLEKDEHNLPMKVQTVMGNGTTPDEWYPYWRMKAPIPDRWVLASDLGEGNTVSLMPSRFDFEFLDTAARRFEISYDNGKRQGIFLPGSTYHPARPYYLEQLDEFEKLWEALSEVLETTQIDNLVGIIEEKRMEWLADRNDEVFKQTVYDALDNANWRPDKHPKPESDTFKQLRRAALGGQLTDVVELYMHILKQRPHADESQAKNMTGVTL